MEYSTKNFLEAAASDTEADPNFLRFIADTATRGAWTRRLWVSALSPLPRRPCL